MNDVFGFVSLIVLGCGIYTLYAYIKIKKTKHHQFNDISTCPSLNPHMSIVN